MTTLRKAEIDRFRADGYIVAEDAVTPAELAALNAELDAWIEESRVHAENFGDTLDGKARFDLEDGHSAAVPRLRRIANPVEISDAYRRVMTGARYVDMVADLIGPDVKFHHCKLNVKLPHSPQRVGWHQDHPYDPHTNDDVVVALLMLNDMTVENGALHVVPGSHRERYSLYRGDAYTGEISTTDMAALAPRAVPVTGRAGSVCLQHTWMVRGSGGNRTEGPRNLFITDYTAADAIALTPPAVPNTLHGTIVRGRPTRFARLKEMVIELPQPYGEDSFFTLQAKAAKAAE